jgi:hypothetical protein
MAPKGAFFVRCITEQVTDVPQFGASESLGLPGVLVERFGG